VHANEDSDNNNNRTMHNTQTLTYRTITWHFNQNGTSPISRKMASSCQHHLTQIWHISRSNFDDLPPLAQVEETRRQNDLRLRNSLQWGNVRAGRRRKSWSVSTQWMTLVDRLQAASCTQQHSNKPTAHATDADKRSDRAGCASVDGWSPGLSV